jgi:hypothetical protein
MEDLTAFLCGEVADLTLSGEGRCFGHFEVKLLYGMKEIRGIRRKNRIQQSVFVAGSPFSK